MSKFRINQINLRDWVWRNPDYPITAKVILLDLLWYAGSNNSAFPSQQTIADNHGITPRYVRKMLKILKNNHCIDWQKSGFSKSNIYEFHKDLYDNEE